MFTVSKRSMPRKLPALTRPDTDRDVLRQDLQRRMSRPQRHRLLHGYPMAPLMRPSPSLHDPLAYLLLDSSRPLIIGVLPHTFCNPKVKGCGFCTFPHEKFTRKLMRDVVDHVALEIMEKIAVEPSLRERHVDGVYFGGGTANLTPPEGLQKLCDALGDAFDLSKSEVTLEGVPRYFLLQDQALLDVLAAMKVRHRRISMGVQTFDRTWIERMGRDAFGNRDVIAQVVRAAHDRGFTASADLLFNLPSATLEHALEDIRSACEIGFDQICVYNLVLNAELDTEWACDEGLVRAMPSNEKACANWLVVRQALIDRGYVQTTLTNFERAEIVVSERRFVYERASFDPATWDAIGFGPAAISTFTSKNRRYAIKWMNEETSERFVKAMKVHDHIPPTAFDYSPIDLKLLHLTRNFARMSVDCDAYQAFFGSQPQADFSTQLQILQEARLIQTEDRMIELTKEGMFFADAVVGLLASQRVAGLRTGDVAGAVLNQRMG